MGSGDDFEKVQQAGGTITFNIKQEGDQRLYQIGFQGQATYRMGISALWVLLPNGIPVAGVALGGIGSPLPQPPIEPALLVMLPSDREGMFGRRCPRCSKYFRTDGSPHLRTYCPYCGLRGGSHQFLSDGQRGYVQTYVARFLDGYERCVNVSIDLDRLGEEVGANTAPASFSEERQQTRFRCAKCNVTSDVIGRYGYCPACGRRNTLAMLAMDLAGLEERIQSPRYPEHDRERREGEWRSIVRECVSQFEAFGRDLLSRLAKIPSSPKRKKIVAGISFHQPIEAARAIESLFDVELLRGLSQEDQQFIRTRFLRRHVYEHCGGVADQAYVDAVHDSSVVVGQLLRERSNNVGTLIRLVKVLAENFDEAFHSIG